MKLTIAVALISFNVALAAVTPLRHKITPEQAEQIAAWKIGDPGNPWEMSGQYQGDMILTADQKNGLVDTRYRWPGNELPYVFHPSVSESDRNSIRNALSYYNSATCVSVVERTSQSDYVTVTTAPTGCWSYVGRLGGNQELNLQSNGCIWTSTILHEFLHALGFYHMQSTHDRDDYVDILLENVQSGTEHNFDKFSASVVDNFGETYDYKSVMHYGETAFSVNGQPTIRAKDGTSPLGNNVGLTDRDRNKLQRMYGCPV